MYTPTPRRFSGRHRRTLELLCEGLSNREIARHLVVSEETVEGYVSEMLRRTRLRNRTQLALMAVGRGWVERDIFSICETIEGAG